MSSGVQCRLGPSSIWEITFRELQEVDLLESHMDLGLEARFQAIGFLVCSQASQGKTMERS